MRRGGGVGRVAGGQHQRSADPDFVSACNRWCRGVQPVYRQEDAGEGKAICRTADVYHAYHLYVIQVEDRLGLYNFLRENGIFAQVLYYPLNLMPYYKQFGNKEGDLPVVEEYYKHCLALPMFPTLTDEQQQYVISKVKKFVNK